jgi:enoyl-CoA hydratase/carnithine racemase
MANTTTAIDRGQGAGGAPAEPPHLADPRAAFLRLEKNLSALTGLTDKFARITDEAVALLGAEFARIWIVAPGDRCESGCLHARFRTPPHFCQSREFCLHLIASSGRYRHTNGAVHSRIPLGAYKVGPDRGRHRTRFGLQRPDRRPALPPLAVDQAAGAVFFRRIPDPFARGQTGRRSGPVQPTGYLGPRRQPGPGTCLDRRPHPRDRLNQTAGPQGQPRSRLPARAAVRPSRLCTLIPHSLISCALASPPRRLLPLQPSSSLIGKKEKPSSAGAQHAGIPNRRGRMEFWKQWETIRLETNAASPEIGLMTLNRPDKLNAVNLAMMQDLHACLDFLNHAFDCRVVILRGAGRIFCAGADLTSSPAGDAGYDWAKFPDKVKSFWQMQHELSSAILKFRRIPQPVLAAVHGAAVGAGMAFCNASDIVIATRGAKFVNAYIKIGVSGADCGSSYFLPRTVGFHRSAELMYTGRDLPAEEAHRWGYGELPGGKGRGGCAVRRAVRHRIPPHPKPSGIEAHQRGLELQHGRWRHGGSGQARGQEPGPVRPDRRRFRRGSGPFFEKRKPRYGAR